MGAYYIHLIHVDMVRPTELVRQVIRAALGPLATEAGHELMLLDVPVGRPEPHGADVSVRFERNTDSFRSGDAVLGEQSGVVWVGSMLRMRVNQLPPRRCSRHPIDPADPLEGSEFRCEVEYANRVRSLFENGELEFAHAVANVAVHELGHAIGGLEHVEMPRNFMFTGACLDDVLPYYHRTYERLRELWSRWHHFSDDQRRRMVRAMRERELAGIEMRRMSRPDAP